MIWHFCSARVYVSYSNSNCQEFNLLCHKTRASTCLPTSLAKVLWESDRRSPEERMEHKCHSWDYPMVLFALTEMQTREKSPGSNDRKCTMLTLAPPKATSLKFVEKEDRMNCCFAYGSEGNLGTHRDVDKAGRRARCAASGCSPGKTRMSSVQWLIAD